METPSVFGCHNLVVYVDPPGRAVSLGDLDEDPEKALSENAMWFFIENPSYRESERERLRRAYKRYGKNMFIWKYYLAARHYLGGYKALSAHLMLRRSP